jgi:nicotinamide-nucleotide amidase
MSTADSCSIKRICDECNLKVATAESVSVGRMQSDLASISGASTFFEGGVTAYSIDQKVRLLNVDRESAAQVDCVSARVAAEMAAGAVELFKVDLGVSTTGYAEPPDASTPAYAFYAVWDKSAAGKNPVRAGRVAVDDVDRVDAQSQVASFALRELARYLEQTRQS